MPECQSEEQQHPPRRLAEFLQKEGQFLLPMVELVCKRRRPSTS